MKKIITLLTIVSSILFLSLPVSALDQKKEIIKLKEKIEKEGYTLIPLKVYFNKNKVKVLLGLCKGKKTYDKREVLKEKEIKRKIEREIKSY